MGLGCGMGVIVLLFLFCSTDRPCNLLRHHHLHRGASSSPSPCCDCRRSFLSSQSRIGRLWIGGWVPPPPPPVLHSHLSRFVTLPVRIPLRREWMCKGSTTLSVIMSSISVMTPWRNGSASDSRPEGCVFKSRRGHWFSFSWLKRLMSTKPFCPGVAELWASPKR
jgi:hypothetical protein